MTFEIRLKGKNALVTGAGRGIGREIAITMSKAGAKLFVNDIDSQSCERTISDIEKTGGAGAALVGDVCKETDVNSMMGIVATTHGGIDILVNNAGIAVRKPVVQLSEEEWDRVLDVNLKGTFLCARAAAQMMIKQGRGGRIINISSIMGEVALSPRSAYCASKGGVIALTRELAVELAEHNITVNAIGPGWISTELTRAYFSQSGVSDYLIDRIPLKRFGTTQEVAAIAVFLASEYTSYMTGQTMFVDGGWTAL